MKDSPELFLEGGGMQIFVDTRQLDKRYGSKRQATGWGYTDEDLSGDLDAFIGIPKLENN